MSEDRNRPGEAPIPDPARPPLPDPEPDPAPGPASGDNPAAYSPTYDRSLRDEPDEIPEPAQITLAAIPHALAAGWRDFTRAPVYGLMFSAFYVAGGLALLAVARATGQEWWLMPFIVGFPLLAPFAAIGLYEVSRRLEVGQPLNMREVLGVVMAQKDRQIPSMSMVILLLFMFWVFVAHTVFAMFIGPSAMTNVSSSLEILNSQRGYVMLGIGTLIGGGFAAVLFCVTVIGLPLLLDREVDFISAIIASFGAVAASPLVMLVWAALIAALLFLGMAPAFLGLFIVMPVLGHASWHLYRTVMGED